MKDEEFAACGGEAVWATPAFPRRTPDGALWATNLATLHIRCVNSYTSRSRASPRSCRRPRPTGSH